MSDAEQFEINYQAIQDAYDAFASGNWAFCFATLSALLKEARRCGEDEWLEWAERHAQRRARWYRDRLKHEILSSWKAGEFANREAMHERLERRADELTAHNSVALGYLTVSTNRDACLEQRDDVPRGKGFIDWNAIASMALQQDVLEDLFDEHILGDSEPLQVRNGWCPTCETWKPENELFPFGEYVCLECTDD